MKAERVRPHGAELRRADAHGRARREEAKGACGHYLLLAGDEGERGAIAVRVGAVLARHGEARRPREWRGGRCGLLLLL